LPNQQIFPTPESVTPLVAKYLTRGSEGLIRILDPCAGTGAALRQIGDGLHAETFGIEVDLERGNLAKETLTRCLVTDYRNTRISHGAFSLLWLNPPYDWAARSSDIERSERYERTFLRDCVCYLCPGGILVYLIPQNRLDSRIARMLSYRFQEIMVYRFPEEAHKSYRQLVILGILKRKPASDEAVAEHLKNCGPQNIAIPSIPIDPPRVYEVPLSPGKSDFLFRSTQIDPDDLYDEILRHGLFDRLRTMTMPLRLCEKIRPIMPLRHGHLAQILACGLMNGTVWDKEKRNPLIIKGITTKEVKQSVEIEGDCERHIETDVIKITIRAFNREGDLLTIE